jgi:chaperonin GroEL (HSP60 family)
VTIAKELGLKSPQENLGAKMIREATERTSDAVGDGTTTSRAFIANRVKGYWLQQIECF